MPYESQRALAEHYDNIAKDEASKEIAKLGLKPVSRNRKRVFLSLNENGVVVDATEEDGVRLDPRLTIVPIDVPLKSLVGPEVKTLRYPHKKS